YFAPRRAPTSRRCSISGSPTPSAPATTSRTATRSGTIRPALGRRTRACASIISCCRRRRPTGFRRARSIRAHAAGRSRRTTCPSSSSLPFKAGAQASGLEPLGVAALAAEADREPDRRRRRGAGLSERNGVGGFRRRGGSGRRDRLPGTADGRKHDRAGGLGGDCGGGIGNGPAAELRQKRRGLFPGRGVGLGEGLGIEVG